jgi:hypothetical protein
MWSESWTLWRLIKGIPGSNLALQGDPEFWAGWVQPRPNFLDAGRRSGALADHFCTISAERQWLKPGDEPCLPGEESG